jgi:hypothetical protein
MPTRRKASLTCLYNNVCGPGLGSARAGSLGPGTCLQEEKSRIYLVYFTLCVCRPGLGSAWAGSLKVQVHAFKKKAPIILFIIISSKAIF